ncbi:MAG: GNAT family N-acetyltransferase [archaeon]
MVIIVPFSTKFLRQVRDLWVSSDVLSNTAIKADLSLKEAESKLVNPDVFSIVALEGEKALGAARLCFGKSKKSHCAEFVVFVGKQDRRKGVGSLLLEEILFESKKRGLKRLELTVFEDNSPAIKLYEKMGFVKEGVKKEGLQREGKFFDEIMMARVLD